MSESERFLALLTDQQSADKSVREAAEHTVLSAAKNSPETFVSMCFQVIENTAVGKHQRMAAAIVLRKALYPAQGDAVYRRLPPQSQEAFRRNVLILLARLEEDSVKSLVADLIGTVAASILTDEQLGQPREQRWSDLLPHLFELFASQSTPANVVALFKIFDCLFAKAMDALSPHLPQLAKLFEAVLSAHPRQCQMQALEALVTLLQAVKRKDLRHLRSLKATVIRFVAGLAAEHAEEDLETAMGMLIDITETEPGFFKPEVDTLLALADQARVVAGEGEAGLKAQGVELLMPIFEGFPELFAQSPKRLEAFFALVVKNMLDVDDEVAAEWATPPDGFNDELEEDDDQRPIKFSIDIVNRLFEIVGHKEMLAFLAQHITPLVQSGDWKHRHAAIMVLSQAGEYMADDLNQVAMVISIVAHNAKDTNPRLRYACCHLLGQFADDLANSFQKRFHAEYFAIVLPMLSDPVPRVVAHCLASLTNFLENSTKEQLAPHFQLLYTKMIGWLTEGICFVKEAALSAISALCEGAPELFEQAVDPLMEIIFNILKNANAGIYKVLKGNAVECATILCKYTKPERFEKYATPLIIEMIAIVQSGISYEGVDPQKSFLLSGFQRLALVMPNRLAPHMDAIMASLLHMAQASLGEDADISARTSLGEETELALQLMASFLQNLSAHMVRFEEQIYTMMNIIIDKSLDAEIRVTALDVLGALAKLYGGQPTASNRQVVRKTVEKIWALIEAEEDGEIISDELRVLEKVLKYAGNSFSEAELQQLYAKCKAEMQRSLTRKAKLADEIDEEDELEDIRQAENEREEIEKDVQLQIANTFGAIFRSHGQAALPLFHQAVTELVTPALSAPAGIQFALFIIDDAVEHLKGLIPQQMLLFFLNAMVAHSQHADVAVRQGCVFGIGVTAVALSEAFEPVFENCYRAVEAVLARPSDEHTSPRELKSCADNCYSAQGKMIAAVGAKLPGDRLGALLRGWLAGLPLLEDKRENAINMLMLLNVVKSKPELIPGADAAQLQQLLEVFAQVYHEKKSSSAEIDAGIRDWTRQLLANEHTKAAVVALPLSKVAQEFLNTIVAGG